MPKPKRSPPGEASILVRYNKLRLRIPRQCDPDGKQREICLDLADTKAGRTVAAQILAKVQLDLYTGKFDPSLAKYKQSQTARQLTIHQLWSKYVDYKRPNLKASTIHYYDRIIGDKLAQIPHQICDALDVRQWLIAHTSPAYTARCLNHLASACEWAIRHDQIDLPRNQYVGMAKEISKSPRSPVNAFSIDERDSIIDAYFYSPKFDYYYTFVYFLFLTGCRPSEAIGIQWGKIDLENKSIDFSGSIVRVNSQAIRVERSKTNRSRSFPINEELADLIDSIDGERSPANLVFPSRKDYSKPLEYTNFCHRAWEKVVFPIVGRKTTPYSCRDTFITHQIAQGIPIEVVAKWVDNSAPIIRDRYFDVSAVSFIPK
jgi:integrase